MNYETGVAEVYYTPSDGGDEEEEGDAPEDTSEKKSPKAKT